MTAEQLDAALGKPLARLYRRMAALMTDRDAKVGVGMCVTDRDAKVGVRALLGARNVMMDATHCGRGVPWIGIDAGVG